MKIPEYLILFSRKGNFEVEVKFKNENYQVIKLKMDPEEITKLINKEKNEFYTEMYFDEYLFEIYKYQIDPIKKKITIFAREK